MCELSVLTIQIPYKNNIIQRYKRHAIKHQDLIGVCRGILVIVVIVVIVVIDL